MCSEYNDRRFWVRLPILVCFFYSHSRCIRQQGRQREPNVKILRSPLSAEFWRHCVLSGRTQRRALPRHQNEEMEI